MGGGSRDKIFFSGLNMYQAKSGVKKFSLYWDRVPPLKIWDLGPPQKSETWDPPPKIWDLGPPTPRKSETWDPPENLRHGTPPPKVNRQTFPSINITFPRTTYAGGKNKSERVCSLILILLIRVLLRAAKVPHNNLPMILWITFIVNEIYSEISYMK